MTVEREKILEDLHLVEDLNRDYVKILANLHYTHFALLDTYKEILKPYGLSFPQSNVLSIIVHFYPQELALEDIRKLVLEPGSDVSRTVARLEEKGYVTRGKNKENKRKRSIKATATGLRAIKKLERDARFYDLVKNIPLRQAQSFVKALDALRNGHI